MGKRCNSREFWSHVTLPPSSSSHTYSLQVHHERFEGSDAALMREARSDESSAGFSPGSGSLMYSQQKVNFEPSGGKQCAVSGCFRLRVPHLVGLHQRGMSGLGTGSIKCRFCA